MLPSVQEMEAYIRQVAAANGVDPDTAVRVARSEGLAPGVWQAQGNISYGRERSYGPFQLHVDPRPGHGGMGNDMLAQTGVDPSNPANWRQGVDFAMKQAARGGWSPWYGAKKIGVTGMMGINGRPAGGTPPAPAQGTAMGGFAAGPGAVAARNPTAPPAASVSAWEAPPPSPMSGLASALSGMVGGARTPQPAMAQPEQAPLPDYAGYSKQLADQSAEMRRVPEKGYGAPGLPTLAEILGSM